MIVLHQIRSHFASIMLQFSLIVIAFISFFDPNILNPGNIGWISEGDLRQHYLGWTAFRQAETLGAPWGNAPLLAYPHGTPLAATDSNPLVSILLWPISDFLPADFQFIGLWYLLSITLGFMIARSLLGHAGFDKVTSSLAGAFLAFQPILFWRYGHDTLTAQWLILAAIHVSYVTQSYRSAVLQHATLLLLSIMIHPYLFMMLNFVVGFDLLIRANRQLGPRFGIIELTTLCFIAAQATALYVGGKLGVFSLETLAPNQIGIYSTDLFSIFNPFDSSQFVPQIPSGDGQYEGYAYLGMGSFVVLGYVIFLKAKRLSEPMRVTQIIPLVLAALVAFIFALSPIVTILGTPVLELELSDTSLLRSIFEKLRSSGRFVWISVYVGIFSLLLALPRARSTKTQFILAVALFVQLMDLAPLRARALLDTKHRDVPMHELMREEWAERIERAAYIYLSRPLGLEFSLEVGAAAFPLKTPVSFFYTAQGLGMARQQAAEEQLRLQMLSGNFKQSSLVLLDEEFELPIVHRNASDIVVTRHYDNFHVVETEAYLGDTPMSQSSFGLTDVLKICSHRCTAVLVSQGEAFTFLSAETKQFLSGKGSQILQARNGDGFVAILRDGVLVDEMLAPDEALINAMVGERSFSLKANSALNTASSLSIEGVDLTRNQTGMNVAMVWDNGRHLSVVYDTAKFSDSLYPSSLFEVKAAIETEDGSLELDQMGKVDQGGESIDLGATSLVSSAEPFIGLHRYLSEESSLLDILTDCRQACTMAISVKDEGAASMPRAVRQKAAQIGLALSELEFRDGYSAIVENGIVLVQGRSFQEVVDVTEVVQGTRIRVRSAGFDAGNLSSIRFDNVERSMARRGVNIVVLLDGIKVITYHFDTHGSK